MWRRRITYLCALVGCLVFYGCYREWFSWFLLVTVALLPWFSLVISLPALLSVQAKLRCPESARMDMPVRTALIVKCRFPTPPVRCRLRLHNTLNGRGYVGKAGEKIPTEHCGCITVSYDRLMVYDYLGLFCRRLRKGESVQICILPKPVQSQLPEGKSSRSVSLWRPKPGGGFSENHELRYYRPGDELHNIHWKMSAKTGKLIYREPIEPVLQGHLLTLALTGTEAELDRKLGQLLSASNQLLAMQQPHEVRCLTGKGEVRFTVTDGKSRDAGIWQLLSSPRANTEGRQNREAVLWQHHIGGDSHEA